MNTVRYALPISLAGAFQLACLLFNWCRSFRAKTLHALQVRQILHYHAFNFMNAKAMQSHCIIRALTDHL